MQDEKLNWKAAGEAADGDLQKMMSLCQAVMQSDAATAAQIEAAKALRRSLFTATRQLSEMRAEVVSIRFRKLLDLIS
jgi:hypothetical protein